MKTSIVILVDANDNPKGTVDKTVAHSGDGILHRAVSVFLVRHVNDKSEILLQKRSSQKQLWPNSWTNTVCTHPAEHESYEMCASRRLHEEMGISYPSDNFRVGFRFEYKANYDAHFSEHELDTVLFGLWDGSPVPDKKEVGKWRWVSVDAMRNEMKTNPSAFTPWFRLIMNNPKTKKIISSL